MLRSIRANLAKEVDVYGYHFSWKEHALTIAVCCAGIVSVGILFKLPSPGLLILLAATGTALPILIIDTYKRMYEQRRFADVTSYMEQMLYSFQKTGKAVSAWKETVSLFEEGMMRSSIEAAIEHVERGTPDSERGVLREAMELIEKNYRCTKLSIVHELIAGTEENGGSVEDPVILLLEDLENWKSRGYHLAAEKKKCHGDNIVSIIFSIILCAAALYVLYRMQRMFGFTDSLIFENKVIEISSTVFLVVLLFVYCKSSRTLTEDWLNDAGTQDADYALKSYEKVMRYEERKKSDKSRILPGTGFAIRLAKRDVTRELYLVLPEWLMEMILLLQNNSVQVALIKSQAGAPAILEPELDAMRERMDEYPERLTTYTSFFGCFDVPEIASCMKMLHSVSESGTGCATVQLTHLLSRVHQMQDQADAISNEKIAFRMKMIFSYPVMAATVKLMIDLTVGMALMMQNMGNLGGL